jgi:hypothetical protein
MDEHERDELRALQDALLEHVGHYPPDTQVSVNMPGVTVKELRKFLWPQYRHEIRAMLKGYRGNK